MKGVGCAMPRVSRFLCAVTVATAVFSVALASGSASAGQHWSTKRCKSTYGGWLRAHRHASVTKKLAYQAQLNRKHGCKLVRKQPFHPKPQPLVPLVGLGETEGAWRAGHQTDPSGITNSFDPMPGRFPGQITEDEFLVTFEKGAVTSFFQRFAPGTTQSAASSAVHALLPSDTLVAVPAESLLGKCGGEELRSYSLSVEGPIAGNEAIIATYASHYGPAAEEVYNPQDVREAYVSIFVGGQVIPAAEFGQSNQVCG